MACHYQGRTLMMRVGWSEVRIEKEQSKGSHVEEGRLPRGETWQPRIANPSLGL